jgi:hypothetical protein
MGERVLGRVSLRLLPPPRCQLNRTREKDVPQILWSQRGDLQADLLPSLVILQEKEETKREKQGLGCLWLKFKFKFEFKWERFENLPKEFPEFPNTNNRS